MDKDFIFIDENDHDKKKVFHKKYYYQFIKELIVNFFNSNFSDNDTNSKIIYFLENLKDYEDVYFFTSEVSYHWALCIIYDTFETAQIECKLLTPQKVNDYIKFYKDFLEKNNNKDFIEEI